MGGLSKAFDGAVLLKIPLEKNGVIVSAVVNMRWRRRGPCISYAAPRLSLISHEDTSVRFPSTKKLRTLSNVFRFPKIGKRRRRGVTE